MTRKTPIILVSLLLVGTAIVVWFFASNLSMRLPEAVGICVIPAGLLFLAVGLLFGIVGSLRALLILARSDTRKASGIRIPILTLLITALAWSPVIFVAVLRTQENLAERRILGSDRTELLWACRQIIANYDSYTNKTIRGQPSRMKDHKVLITWDDINDRSVDQPPLPESIRRLVPRWIDVGSNYVIINPCKPLGSSIIAYSEGTDYYPLYYTNYSVQLTNGLYFRKGRYVYE